MCRLTSSSILIAKRFVDCWNVALRERRPLVWQAEILLRRALGLPFPVPLDQETAPEPPEVVCGSTE